MEKRASLFLAVERPATRGRSHRVVFQYPDTPEGALRRITDIKKLLKEGYNIPDAEALLR